MTLEEAMDAALAAARSRDWPAAERFALAILNARADHPGALGLLGHIYIEAGFPDRAIPVLARVLTVDARNPAAFYNLGNAFAAVGRHADALRAYGNALALNPSHFEASFNRGVSFRAIGSLPDAARSFERATVLRPGSADAFTSLGDVQDQLGEIEAALRSYEQALSLNATAVAHYNRANALARSGRWRDAISGYDSALGLDAAFANAWLNRGNVLSDHGAFEAALQSYDEAIRLDAGASAFNNRGNTLRRMKRFGPALQSFDRALALEPDLAEALNNRANTFVEIGQLERALADFDRALAIRPSAGIWMGRANLLRDQKRYLEAHDSCSKALAIDPEWPYALGAWILLKLRMCDWSGLADAVATLEARIAARRPATPPFSMLGIVASAALQRIACETWAADRVSHVDELPPFDRPFAPTERSHRKLHIGYFSADFHEHATMHVLAEFFELHDRERFTTTAFSFGPRVDDPLRQRAVAAFDRFVDVSDHTDRDVALLARESGIDIAIDLKGYTQNNRAGIFAHRAAPIQVAYMGFPGTSGAPWIDYVIADRVVAPPEHAAFFSECIVRLPDTYWVIDRRRAIGEATLDRAAAGLPADGFVFCCFNSTYKITPEVFDRWLRILAAVEGSVLWLLRENEWAEVNLRREAERRGVSAQRLVFAPLAPSAEHLARHRLADLCLDTLPYNAHTTATDALWTGLPVLTCPGESFASRVAASILRAAGLPELVTGSAEHFVARAIELAQGPEALHAIRRRLATLRATAPLFDTERWTRGFEAALRTMHARHVAGEAPASFDVPPQRDDRGATQTRA